MTEQEIASLYLTELGKSMEAFTGVMRAALVAALRWQVANRGMPTEQAEQIVMNTGAALTAALKGMHNKMTAEAEKKPAIITDLSNSPEQIKKDAGRTSVPSLPLKAAE